MDQSNQPADNRPLFSEQSGPVSRPAAYQLWVIAILLWVVPMLVISVMVFLHPLSRTVTPLYHEAATNWWAGQPLYQGQSGMNYLPQFSILFTPFHFIPIPWSDILWRWFAAALLASGLWRVMRARFGVGWPKWFLWATILVLPLSLSALRNGQANALLGGLMLHAVACVADAQWSRAAALMVLTVGVKQLGMVLLLLAPVVYAPLRWRLFLGLAALVVLPFVCARPEYALAQYQALGKNLEECSTVTQHRFADLNGILRTFGTELPPQLATGVRAMAGLGTLALWWLGARRLTQPLQAMWLHALATAYLMLFNPMNEANSYVIFAPALAFWATHWLADSATATWGWWLVGMTLSMGLLPNLVRPLFGNQFALIWHPTMVLIFCVLVALRIWRPIDAGTDVGRPQPLPV